MVRRLGQGIGVGEIRIGEVVQAVLPGLVPQIEHAAHGGIDPALRQSVIGFAVEQQVDDGLVHGNRLAGVVVDGLQVVQPLVVVVDIEKLMVSQELIMDRLGLGREGSLAFSPAQDGGDGVENRQEGGGILLLLLPRSGAAAQEHGEDQQYCK